MKPSYFYILSVIALLSCSCHGDKNILLQLKLTKQQKTDVKYRTYETADNEENATKSEYVRMALKVDSVLADSSYQFSAKVDFVRAKDPELLGGVEYVSGKYQGDMSAAELKLDQQLRTAIDSTYKFTVDKYGKLVKPFEFASGRALPAEYSLINYGIFQITFPGQKIAIGDKWTNEQTIPGTKNKRTATYQIESIYDATIQIKVEGTIADAANQTQKFTGRYYLKKNDCTLDSCKIEMNGDGKKKMFISIASK
jgi:hypothetical protein